jgi:prepilin-type N-terminal cleavage/methylation domain-containing protein/prepilin-type processing-associated H-X9-DG protein
MENRLRTVLARRWAAVSIRYGFTLIELLVVIAIIAILAAVLFPVFAQARAKSRQSSCLSNLRQHGMAIAMYVQDWDAFPPFSYVTSGVPIRWYDQVFAYTRNQDIFVCPAVRRKWAFGQAGRNATYGYNYQYLGNSRTDCWNVPVLESLIETPSQMIAVADSRGTGTRLCDNDEPDDADFLNPDCLFNHGYALDPPLLPPCRFGTGPNRPCSSGRWCLPHERHSDGANFVFADGHAKWCAVAPLYQDNRWWNGRYPEPNP